MLYNFQTGNIPDTCVLLLDGTSDLLLDVIISLPALPIGLAAGLYLSCTGTGIGGRATPVIISYYPLFFLSRILLLILALTIASLSPYLSALPSIFGS